MIGHKTIGKGFGGLARYVLNKPGTQRLPAGTLAGQTPVALAQEVAGLRAARRDLSKPVLHRTLSVTPEEHLTLEQWSWAAVHYMEQLGYGSVPWFAAIHEDAACQHLHICALAIDPTRQDRFGRPARVSDSNDYARSARIIQGIEKKLGLCPGAMTPGEAAQLPWRQPSSPHVQRLARTGEAPEKARLQARIDAALQLAVDFEDFKAHLELAGVEVREYRKADHLSGLSFGLGGYWAKGSQLGKRYTAVSIMNEMEHRNEQRDDHGFKGGVAAPDPAGRGDQGHEPGRGSVGPVARDSGCSDHNQPCGPDYSSGGDEPGRHPEGAGAAGGPAHRNPESFASGQVLERVVGALGGHAIDAGGDAPQHARAGFRDHSRGPGNESPHGISHRPGDAFHSPEPGLPASRLVKPEDAEDEASPGKPGERP
ncbi:MAG TPA: hypothetical protein DD766_08335 [Desulfovibrio sp.]|nr:hypothetical protein [Desulfovibrio sp.]